MAKDKFSTMSWVLESWFGAESVFLKRGYKPTSNEGQYQFMTAKAMNSLNDVLVALDRLASAGIMSQAELEEYKRRICQALIDEFAAQTPPEDGMMYRFIPMGSSMWSNLLMEVVPKTNEELSI